MLVCEVKRYRLDGKPLGAGGKLLSGRSIARRTARGPTPATVGLRALLEALRRRAPPGRSRMRGRASAGLLAGPGSVRILAVHKSIEPIAVHHTTGTAKRGAAQVIAVRHTARPIVVYGPALVIVVRRRPGPLVRPVIVRVFLDLGGAVSWRHVLLIVIGRAGYVRRPAGVVVHILAGVVAVRVVAREVARRVVPRPVILGRPAAVPLALWRGAHIDAAVDCERLLVLLVLARRMVYAGRDRGRDREAHRGRGVLLACPELLELAGRTVYPRRDCGRACEARLARALVDVDAES